jgi:hypothetical protein
MILDLERLGQRSEHLLCNQVRAIRLFTIWKNDYEFIATPPRYDEPWRAFSTEMEMKLVGGMQPPPTPFLPQLPRYHRCDHHARCMA